MPAGGLAPYDCFTRHPASCRLEPGASVCTARRITTPLPDLERRSGQRRCREDWLRQPPNARLASLTDDLSSFRIVAFTFVATGNQSQAGTELRNDAPTGLISTRPITRMAQYPAPLRETDHIGPFLIIREVNLRIARGAGKPDHLSSIRVLRDGVVFCRSSAVDCFQSCQPFLERNRHHPVVSNTLEMQVISQCLCAPNHCDEGCRQEQGNRHRGPRHHVLQKLLCEACTTHSPCPISIPCPDVIRLSSLPSAPWMAGRAWPSQRRRAEAPSAFPQSLPS